MFSKESDQHQMIKPSRRWHTIFLIYSRFTWDFLVSLNSSLNYYILKRFLLAFINFYLQFVEGHSEESPRTDSVAARTGGRAESRDQNTARPRQPGRGTGIVRSRGEFRTPRLWIDFVSRRILHSVPSPSSNWTKWDRSGRTRKGPSWPETIPRTSWSCWGRCRRSNPFSRSRTRLVTFEYSFELFLPSKVLADTLDIGVVSSLYFEKHCREKKSI